MFTCRIYTTRRRYEWFLFEDIGESNTFWRITWDANRHLWPETNHACLTLAHTIFSGSNTTPEIFVEAIGTSCCVTKAVKQQSSHMRGRGNNNLWVPPSVVCWLLCLSPCPCHNHPQQEGMQPGPAAHLVCIRAVSRLRLLVLGGRGDRGRSCEEHDACCGTVLQEDSIVRIRIRR